MERVDSLTVVNGLPKGDVSFFTALCGRHNETYGGHEALAVVF
jgi:hypothetical protein